MSLLELLQQEYDRERSEGEKRFISYRTAMDIVSEDRIKEWSIDHPLCREGGSQYRHPHDVNIIHIINHIRQHNILVFVVLVFAKLESVSKKLMEIRCANWMLFDNGAFKRVSNSVHLTASEQEEIIVYRKHVGVQFVDDGYQAIPDDAILPYFSRRSTNEFGSYGSIYMVKIAGGHLRGYNDDSMFAEKSIRRGTNSSEDYWKWTFREVKTLQKRNNHPNIIPLLAAYTQDTDESGHYVPFLRLIFPLAAMNLYEWMSSPQLPSNVQSLSEQERNNHVYHYIYGLVSGISYLHGEIDGWIATHHDLKPRNILVLNDTLKIADFGHANLHSVHEGSKTEGAFDQLGTYEYQPPEYYEWDGSRSIHKHGRAFDVWALGCIILELATLVVHGWQSKNMVVEFRKKRGNSSKSEKDRPTTVDPDPSFHNNRNVVKSWLEELKLQKAASQLLHGILHTADGMLALNTNDRPPIWEVQLDVHKSLRQHGARIPDFERDLCVPPPLAIKRPWKEMDYIRGETPLHRAIKQNDRSRVIRLWELGWPLTHADGNDKTPLDLIVKSNNVGVQKLEEDVNAMLRYARTGEISKLRELFSNGLSPMMVDKRGYSALHEAILGGRINVVDYLMEFRAEKKLLLLTSLGTTNAAELPIHTASRTGSVDILKRIIEHQPDVNIYLESQGPALYEAAHNNHIDAVRLLLTNGAKVWPKDLLDYNWAQQEYAPLHFASNKAPHPLTCDTMKLLLDAPDSLKNLDFYPVFGLTPLQAAARHGCVSSVEVLLKHGASVGRTDNNISFLRVIAEYGQLDLLQKCRNKIPWERFTKDDLDVAAKEARENGHERVAKLLKDIKRQTWSSSWKNWF